LILNVRKPSKQWSSELVFWTLPKQYDALPSPYNLQRLSFFFSRYRLKRFDSIKLINLELLETMTAIYADQKNSGLFVCPNCGKNRRIDITKHADCQLSINCSCGQKFTFRVKDKGITAANQETSSKPESDNYNKKYVLRFTVDKNGKSHLKCPHCNWEKNVRISSTSSSNVVYLIKCKCGQNFRCRFEPTCTHHDEGNQETYFSFDNVQSTNTEVRAFFVGDAGTVNIICSKCGFIRTVDPNEIPLLKEPFGFNCKCGETFACRIDERKNYRKQRKLRGKYVNRQTSKKYSMMVEDISFRGIGITVDKDHDLRQGDILDLAFTLNDEQRSVIRSAVSIKRIDHQNIGCEFIKDQAYSKKLGFYLLI